MKFAAYMAASCITLFHVILVLFFICSRFGKQRLTAVGIRYADHVTPLYPQKLALASLTGSGRSVGQDPVGL